MEMDQIKEQFKEVIRYSQNIPDPLVDVLFKKWQEAKRPIIHNMFGDQLTLELGKVSYDLSAETKTHKIGIFLNWLDQFYSTTSSLMEFIHWLGPMDFYDNHLTEDYIYDDKKISKGTKVIKAFKHFITSQDLLEAIQNKASELIQENKITGNLVLSVHPLDFLSLSENTSRWRSCHALDGEYRAGNLSYMLDGTTIIAYLRGEGGETHKLPNFPESVPWNNKKWRCLFFLNLAKDSTMVFAGRPYPMALDGALESVREALIPRMSQGGWWYHPEWTNWTNERVTGVRVGDEPLSDMVSGTYYHIGGYIRYNRELIKDAKHSTHYNDLLYSSCYVPLYFFDKSACIDHSFKLRIGAECPCLWCGQDYISTRDTMMCKKCECEHGSSESDHYMHCEYCGARHANDDMTEVDGAWVCPRCVEANTFVCAVCGERLPNHEQRYSEERGGFVCEYCFNKEQERNDKNKAHEINITIPADAIAERVRARLLGVDLSRPIISEDIYTTLPF